MIGGFARRWTDAQTEIEVEGKEFRLKAADGSTAVAKDLDAAPKAFAETVAYDGGDVVYSPVVEALRRIFRKRAP